MIVKFIFGAHLPIIFTTFVQIPVHWDFFEKLPGNSLDCIWPSMLLPYELLKLVHQSGGVIPSNSSTTLSPTVFMMMMMDSMILHFGNREFILFGFWKTGSALGLAASILIVILMSILYEAIRALRIYFARNRAIERQNQRMQSTIIVRESTEHVDSVSSESVAYSPILRFSGIRALQQLFTCYRIVQAALYFAQTLLAYTLMLIAMTFNVWIILGIVFGEMIGYFLFSGEPTFGDSTDVCC